LPAQNAGQYDLILPSALLRIDVRIVGLKRAVAINMTNSRRVIQNASFLSAAYIGQKLLSFVYFTLIARIVGVVDTGAYVFALSFSTICSVFVDFGLSQLLQREIAQKPENTQTLLAGALRLKALYAVVSVAVGLGVFTFIADGQQMWNMIFIAMGIMLFDSYVLTVWAAFRGRHYLAYESIAIVSSQAIVLVVGLIGLYAKAPLEILLLALLAGSAWTAVYATIACRRILGFWPRPMRGSTGTLARRSLSFGVASTFSRLFASLDSVMLGQMVGTAAVGFYAIPNKFVFAAQFIPAAVSASLYPALSHFHLRDQQQMRKLFFQAFSFLYMLAAPMAVGLFILTPAIVHELYTSVYDPSILAMQIMVWGIIFGFLEYPFGALLAAMGQQKKNSITRVVVVFVNVALNLILIPRFSFVGTAIAAVASYAVLTGMGAFWSRAVLRDADRAFVLGLVKVTLSALLMGVGVWAIFPYAHFAVAIVFGGVVYAGCAVWMRVVTLGQIMNLIVILRRKEVADV